MGARRSRRSGRRSRRVESGYLAATADREGTSVGTVAAAFAIVGVVLIGITIVVGLSALLAVIATFAVEGLLMTDVSFIHMWAATFTVSALLRSASDNGISLKK